MDNAIVHHRRLAVLTLGVVLALAMVVVLPEARSAAPEPNENAPDPIDLSFETDVFCGFTVLGEITGKTKTIDLPGGARLVTNPALRTTLTNVEEPDNQLSFGITGTGRETVLENGDLLVVARGRNLLLDPGEGMFLTKGRVEFIVTTGGDLTFLESKGKVIDLCAALA